MRQSHFAENGGEMEIKRKMEKLEGSYRAAQLKNDTDKL
jgi:hypothetical protein